MEHSDVRVNGYGRVAVFQPSLTVGMKKNKLAHGKRELLQDLFSGIMKMEDLTHVATLKWNSNSISGQSRCGGKLVIGELTNEPYTYDYAYLQNAAEKVRFTCSNPECGLDMTLKIPMVSLKSSFLHLLLKQMVPDYQSANYFNCLSVERNDAYWSHQQLGDEGWESIRRMGTVPVLGKVLWGLERNFGKNELWAYKDYDLGLLAIEGLNSSRGCDGLDRWLQFLVCKLQESWKQVLQITAPTVLGPKKVY